MNYSLVQDGELVRSFIAIDLPRNVKKGLEQIQYAVKQGGYAGIKWVNPEDIHITLKFMGNTSREQIIEIIEVLEVTTQEFSSFHMEIADLGAFPDLGQPRILWVAINGEVAILARLQQRIDLLLKARGFANERRPFMPHLTLARIKDNVSPVEKRKIGKFIESLKFEAGFPFYAEAVSLIKSQLMPTGAIYSCLFTSRLKSNKYG